MMGRVISQSVTIGTDRYIELSKDGKYVHGIISGNLADDDTYIAGEEYSFQTKIINANRLSGCIAVYIETKDNIYILHASPSQALNRPDLVSMEREFIKPYSQLQGKLSGSIHVQVYGHVNISFDESIFRQSMEEEGVTIASLTKITPPFDGLLDVSFNFEKDTVEVHSEDWNDSVYRRSRYWSLSQNKEIASFPTAKLQNEVIDVTQTCDYLVNEYLQRCDEIMKMISDEKQRLVFKYKNDERIETLSNVQLSIKNEIDIIKTVTDVNELNKIQSKIETLIKQNFLQGNLNNHKNKKAVFGKIILNVLMGATFIISCPLKKWATGTFFFSTNTDSYNESKKIYQMSLKK